MLYFKTKLKYRKDKKAILKSLNSLIDRNPDNFFVFPFCLFSKSYYKRLKDKRESPFIGKVTENDFEFHRYIYYGFIAGRTARNLKIKGKVQENEEDCIVELGFYSSKFELILEIVLFIGFITFYIFINNPILIIIPAYILFEKSRITLFNFLKIRNRLV